MNLEELIINKIPNNLNDLEKARFVYIELCKLLSFDTSHKYNTNREILSEKINREIDIRNLKDTLVNCVNIANIYTKLLEMLNIKSKVVRDTSTGHAWNIIYIDNFIIMADATRQINMDIVTAKYPTKTRYFVLVNYLKDDNNYDLSKYEKEFDEYIDNIDTKLGYDKERNKYLEFINSLKEEALNYETLYDKVKYIFSRLDFSNKRFFDGYNYINDVIYNVLQCRIDSVILHKTLPDLSATSILCYIIDEHYFIYEEDTGVNEISKDFFTKLNNMGYGTTVQEIPNIKTNKFEIYNNTIEQNISLSNAKKYTKKYNKDKNFIIKK